MKYLYKIVFLLLFFTSTLADELSEQLDKIDKQLNSVGELYDAGVLSEEDYQKTKKKLLDQAEAARKAAEEKEKAENERQIFQIKVNVKAEELVKVPSFKRKVKVEVNNK